MTDHTNSHGGDSERRRSGSLVPPGPPAPTGKSIDEVQTAIPVNETNTPGDERAVFRISRPGRYYLTGDIDAGSKDGIEIQGSRGVTLDLNGFTIRGNGSIYTAGILLGYMRQSTGTTIRNGRIIGFGGDGIEFSAGATVFQWQTFAHIEDVSVSECNVGMRLLCMATIRNCRVEANTTDGVIVSVAKIEDTWVSGNGRHGIYAFDSVSASRCILKRNMGIGLFAFTHGAVSQLITECIAMDNGGDGFYVKEGVVIERCIASGNGTGGIRSPWAHVRVRQCLCRNNRSEAGDAAGILAHSSIVEDCLCVDNDRGIVASGTHSRGMSRIWRNACSGNDVNWEFSAGSGGVVIEAGKMDAVEFGPGGPIILPEVTTLGSMDARVNYTF